MAVNSTPAQRCGLGDRVRMGIDLPVILAVVPVEIEGNKFRVGVAGQSRAASGRSGPVARLLEERIRSSEISGRSAGELAPDCLSSHNVVIQVAVSGVHRQMKTPGRPFCTFNALLLFDLGVTQGSFSGRGKERYLQCLPAVKLNQQGLARSQLGECWMPGPRPVAGACLLRDLSHYHLLNVVSIIQGSE